ncbi:uncharacterized protein B0I36DRAFT_330726 [Microdochium trichocladiopsis]|uniref:SPT2 chromatin protein-domain-containing protein n=1 Tax=Microdochium trichocladiopsis TaxID=1682393 RepID=A0A9P8Y1R9_9PEZI|nr:uncharacterized protein B0I36DRAFT_330726 [Microdochium trichocladiopsis]KAH7026476.1 hypothetical protein B0I36DRAFT_330726 [Microdochium trichocladiopsis]
MPIGDLLAEISGKPSSPSTGTSAPPAPAGLKRKISASSSLTSNIAKKPATESSAALVRPKAPSSGGPSTSSSVRRTDSEVTASQRPNGSASGPPTISRNGDLGHAQVRRHGPDTSRPRPISTNRPAPSVAPRPSPTAARPAPTTSAAPKKGSFAEIMARGAKAQQTMGKVGVIQHKPISKPMNKKDRDLAKLEDKSTAKRPSGKFPGVAGKVPPTAAQNGSRMSSGTKATVKGGAALGEKPGPGKKGSKSSSAESSEKKVKKSTSATTGYTGTARPVPGATRGGAAGRAGGPSRPGQRDRGLLAPPKASRRGQADDDYDEDMDDFIDYDDEEAEADPYGRPGRYVEYDSDGSSDMEAGLSDIDSEERAAERFARNEDKREQMLEEKLRREKEERKKRLAQGYR